MASRTPCAFFAQGKCRKGARCQFSHSDDYDAATRSMPCKFYLQGHCRAGRSCQFSHTAAQQAQSQSTVVSSTGEARLRHGAIRQTCKFFLEGTCTAGSRCPYIHETRQKDSNSDRKQTQTKSGVKMHVLKKNGQKSSKEQAEAQDAEEKAPPPVSAWTQSKEENEEDGSEGENGTELRDLISREEDVYYYGAPGEFEDISANPTPAPQHSYREIASKNIEEDFSDPVQEHPAPPKLCTFYLQGLCRYGDSCFYSHDENASARVDEDEQAIVAQEIEDSKELECNICYDLVYDRQERFGLLLGCNHAFCLSCVRNWRGQLEQSRQSVRQCPVCRVETHFIVPCNRMVTDPERKERVVEEYKKSLAKVPCRHFDQGRGTCPFGTSCFYAHNYPDGTPAPREVRTAVDSEGNYDVLRQVRLENYLGQPLS